MASEAERLLVTTHFSGERERFNFESYVKIQRDQHHILEELKEHGHMGIDTSFQVRYLIQGINITDFEAVKAEIMAAASLRNYSYGFASLYKTFIDQSKKVSPPELNIFGVESSNHK